MCSDGCVYNLEVDAHHNYFANGFLVHNCHRSLSQSYQDIAAYYPNAVHLGLTATPYRADGRGLGDMYQELVVVASPRQLIDEGFLVEPSVFTVPREHLPDLSSVHVRAGDYESKALEEAVNRKGLVGNIVEHWLQLAKGKRSVAFAASVEHSKHIAERFREAGISAEHLDGTTPSEERDAILGRLNAGITSVVSNCGILCEGWDQPAVKCAILARPTKSTGLYLQQAGRILRPWNDERAIILDHAGCAVEHGLPQDDREFSLEGKKKSGRRVICEAPTKVCPSCCAVVHAACRICPECQGEFPRPEGIPEERSGTLVSAHEAREEYLRDEWEKLNRTALERGYKPGWVFHRFKERFGRLPPKRRVQPSGPAAPGDHYKRILAQEPDPVWAALRYRVEFGEMPPST
jgi:superfamily II DNA or RNA helicase